LFSKNFENKNRKYEINKKNKKDKIIKNTKNQKYKNKFKKNNIIKNNINNNISKQDKYIKTTNKLVNINDLLLSHSNFPHYLSEKCKSDNKLSIIGSEFKNKDLVSRNSIREYSYSKLNKDMNILNLIERKNLFNSKKRINNEERNKIRKTLQKFYDKQFPNKVNTNDIIKLFLLLNEYIINNNLLSDYNLNDNKNILNNLSEILSNYSSVDYPKEYDINMDNYINSVKIIQRFWRKCKIKEIIGKNEEIHELKKIVVNNYITKAGYKLKKMLGLFNSLIEEFNNIKNSDDINRMFFYVKNLIKRDLTTYEKNMIIKEFINVFINLK
jgi:hypothetical protein